LKAFLAGEIYAIISKKEQTKKEET